MTEVYTLKNDLTGFVCRIQVDFDLRVSTNPEKTVLSNMREKVDEILKRSTHESDEAVKMVYLVHCLRWVELMSWQHGNRVPAIICEMEFIRVDAFAPPVPNLTGETGIKLIEIPEDEFTNHAINQDWTVISESDNRTFSTSGFKNDTPSAKWNSYLNNVTSKILKGGKGFGEA